MNQKEWKYGLSTPMVTIILTLISLVIVATVLSKTGGLIVPTEDSLAFKQEYESLNSKDNGYGGEYKNVFVYPANPMKYATQEEVETLLTAGTGVIYFGFPECPWCRNALDGFLDATWDLGTAEVLYFNNRDERDVVKLNDDGSLVVEKEGTDGYKKILELLGESASVYEGLNDENIKRLYYPTFVFVKDGKIVEFFEGTHPDVEEPAIAMTEAQQNELKEMFKDSFAKLK